MPFWYQIKRNMHALQYFIYREMLVFFKNYKNVVINTLIWPAMSALVNGYVMPSLGLTKDYGSFMLVGTILAMGFYMAFEDATAVIYDIEGDKRIGYDLSLPYSPSLILVKYGVTFALRTIFMTIYLPFIGKLILYDCFPLEQFSIMKFALSYLLGNLLFGFFALLMIAYVNTTNLLDLRMRIIDPLCFFLGCFLFSWTTLNVIWPTLSYIVYINPIVHSMESLRVAFFGQQNYLNYWLSCFIMLIYIGIFFVWSVYALRKRLDFVPLRYKPR